MLRAAALLIIAVSFIPLGDGAGKVLVTQHGVHPFFVAWSRFALGACLALILLGLPSRAAFLDWRMWFRGALIAAGITSIQVALKTVPISDTFAAFFIGPIFSYALAALLLGERVTLPQTLLLVVGFLGVLCVVHPGGDMVPGIEYAVLAGLFYGAFLTTSRWLGGQASPPDMLLTQLIAGAVLLAPFGAPRLPDPTWTTGGFVMASAVFSMAGNFILLFAYRMAPASLLAPFVYTQLISATLVGWFGFGTLPTVWTITGLVLLVAAGFASLLLVRRASSRPAPAKP